MKSFREILNETCRAIKGEVSVEKVKERSEMSKTVLEKAGATPFGIAEKVDDASPTSIGAVNDILSRVRDFDESIHVSQVTPTLEGSIDILGITNKTASAVEAIQGGDPVTAVTSTSEALVGLDSLTAHVGTAIEKFASAGSHAAHVGGQISHAAPAVKIGTSAIQVAQALIECKRMYGASVAAQALIAIVNFQEKEGGEDLSQRKGAITGFTGSDSRNYQKNLIYQKNKFGPILWAVNKYNPTWMKKASKYLITVAVALIALTGAVLALLSFLSVAGMGIPVIAVAGVAAAITVTQQSGRLFRYWRSARLYRSLVQEKHISLLDFFVIDITCGEYDSFFSIGAHRFGATLSDYFRYQLALLLVHGIDNNPVIWKQISKDFHDTSVQITQRVQEGQRLDELRRGAVRERWRAAAKAAVLQNREEEYQKLREHDQSIPDISSVSWGLGKRFRQAEENLKKAGLQHREQQAALAEYLATTSSAAAKELEEVMTLGVLQIIKEKTNILSFKKLRVNYQEIDAGKPIGDDAAIAVMIRIRHAVENCIELNKNARDFLYGRDRVGVTLSDEAAWRKVKSFFDDSLNFLHFIFNLLRPYGLIHPTWSEYDTESQAFGKHVSGGPTSFTWELFEDTGFASHLPFRSSPAEKMFNVQRTHVLRESKFEYSSAADFARKVATHVLSGLYGPSFDLKKLSKIDLVLKSLVK